MIAIIGIHDIGCDRMQPLCSRDFAFLEIGRPLNNSG